VSQTKYCCSLKVKVFAPKILSSGYATTSISSDSNYTKTITNRILFQSDNYYIVVFTQRQTNYILQLKKSNNFQWQADWNYT